MPRIVIFTQPSMASVVATRRIITHHPHEMVAIVLSNPIPGSNLWAVMHTTWKILRKSSWSFFFYKFIESSGHRLLLMLHALCRTKKFHDGSAMSIAALARLHHIPLYQANNLNDPNFIEQIESLKPDYILCIIGQILKSNLINAFPQRLINAHGSYLPRYRGPAQYFWYIQNNDHQFGITVHTMTSGIDTGDIIFQRKFPIPPDISAYYLHYLIAEQFGNMLSEFIVQHSHHYPPRTYPQSDHGASSTRLPSTADVRAFRRQGHRWMTIRDVLHCL